jgi:hypothetical protein
MSREDVREPVLELHGTDHAVVNGIAKPGYPGHPSAVMSR